MPRDVIISAVSKVPKPPKPLENPFTNQVCRYARMMGFLSYHTHNSKHSEAGFPDIILLRPPRLLAVECKRERGMKPTEAQAAWLAAFSLVGAVETYLWTPEDWPSIEIILDRSRETYQGRPEPQETFLAGLARIQADVDNLLLSTVAFRHLLNLRDVARLLAQVRTEEVAHQPRKPTPRLA